MLGLGLRAWATWLRVLHFDSQEHRVSVPLARGLGLTAVGSG